MRVTVVTTEVMHPSLVLLGCIIDCSIISVSPFFHLLKTQLNESPRLPEGQVVFRHKVGASKVSDDAIAVGNTHVSYEGEEPSQQGDRCPYDT